MDPEPSPILPSRQRRRQPRSSSRPRLTAPPETVSQRQQPVAPLPSVLHQPVAAAGTTVTVGTQTYTFVTALSTTPTANEVLVGATETASLANLANAVNGGTGSGATYGSPTVANTSASAVATASTVVFTALTKGLTGNGIATSETGTANTFGAATLANGTAGSTNDLLSIADATAALTPLNAPIQTVAGLHGALRPPLTRLQTAPRTIPNH